MKKTVVILLLVSSFCAVVSARDYETYLEQAYSALTEGKINVAQSNYNVYKKLTGKTDIDFETLLTDAESNDWKRACHIVLLGNGEFLAVQKADTSQIRLTYEDASKRCEANRLGGFSDWRLPTVSELFIVLANVPSMRSDLLFWRCESAMVTEKVRITNRETNVSQVEYRTRYNYGAVKGTGESIDFDIKEIRTAHNVLTKRTVLRNSVSMPYTDMPKCNYLIVRKDTVK